MVTIRLEDIERDLLGYIRRVEHGETLVILRANKPVAEVRPLASGAKSLRPFGLCAGEFVAPEDFDSPLPEAFLREFEGR